MLIFSNLINESINTYYYTPREQAIHNHQATDQEAQHLAFESRYMQKMQPYDRTLFKKLLIRT